MNKSEYLAARFEEHRTHLRAVAYRMLGSVSEVDDAVQEAWLYARSRSLRTRRSRSGPARAGAAPSRKRSGAARP